MKIGKRICAVMSALALTAAAMPQVFAAGSEFYDGASFRIEGEWYESCAEVHATDVDPNIYAPGGGLNITSGGVAYDENDKPYASYRVYIPDTGIYELKYAANYLKDTSADRIYLSPFSVSVNGSGAVMFDGDTPCSGEMTAYTAPSSGGMYGTYTLPVYLEAGENTVKFTVEGGRYNGNPDYVFYLDYFELTYKSAAPETISVESEQLIAGNVPKGNIALLNKDTAGYKNYADKASGGKFYQFNAATKEDGYLKYAVFSPITADFQLTLAGSHTDHTPALKGWDGDYTIVINDGEGISVGSPDGESSDVKTLVHHGDTLDTMSSNKLVRLNKGLNIINVLLDKPAKNGNHVLQLDYMRFSPVTDTVTVEAESSSPAYNDGYRSSSTILWCVNDIPTSDGSFTALDFNITLRGSQNPSDDDFTKHGGMDITYSVYIPREGDYDMSMNMAGYVEDQDPFSYYLPVSLRFDDDEAFRLACEGAGNYVGSDDVNDGKVLETQPEATIERIGSIDVTAAGTVPNYHTHVGYYNTYRLIDTHHFTAGMHTVTFVLSEPPGRGYLAKNARGKFSLDKFVLTPEGEAPAPAFAVLAAEKQTLPVGESTEMYVKLYDENGVSMTSDGSEVVYSSSAPYVAEVEDGMLVTYNPGVTTVTAYVGEIEAKLNIAVYDEKSPYIIIGAKKSGGAVSIDGVYAGNFKPEGANIAAGYGIENGISTTLNGIEPNAEFPDVAYPGMVWNKTLTSNSAIVNSDQIAVFVWDSIEGMRSLYSVTVTE